jgi:uncharacterized cupin superfamily protein
MAGIRVEHPEEDELEVLGVDGWGVWEKEESVFDWSYSDPETCYILEGRAVVETKDGDTVEFKAGDLVTFPAGLECTWSIKERIRKRYAFNVGR